MVGVPSSASSARAGGNCVHHHDNEHVKARLVCHALRAYSRRGNGTKTALRFARVLLSHTHLLVLQSRVQLDADRSPAIDLRIRLVGPFRI